MDSISEIQQHLRFVMSRGFEGINYDFMLIPDLHPFAREACRITDDCPGEQPVFHIYTDGSSKNDVATWAITIVQQSTFEGRNQFHRVSWFCAGGSRSMQFFGHGCGSHSDHSDGRSCIGFVYAGSVFYSVPL